MTDIKLPEEYADWVEKEWPDVIHPDQPPMGRTYLRVIHELVEMNRAGRYVGVQGGTIYLVPPKPKPTLPDVKPGAVIGFRSKVGSVRRAIRGRAGWRVFEQGIPVVYFGMDFADPIANDHELLADVNADGFTVELEGL